MPQEASIADASQEPLCSLPAAMVSSSDLIRVISPPTSSLTAHPILPVLAPPVLVPPVLLPGAFSGSSISARSWRIPIQVITGPSSLKTPLGRTCPDQRIRVPAAAGSNLSV